MPPLLVCLGGVRRSSWSDQKLPIATGSGVSPGHAWCTPTGTPSPFHPADPRASGGPAAVLDAPLERTGTGPIPDREACRMSDTQIPLGKSGDSAQPGSTTTTGVAESVDISGREDVHKLKKHAVGLP